ncbi:hypothetical protein MNBD_GAMMA09-1909 [hydrothermal vent metagenome]|uniref:HDOD domain-containing protein n=1 Tax=hydrothermal vent metagenome TaxID=652676 RepID=A0A3B0XN33_9ZZZZ
MGFDCFQGYFLSQPKIIKNRSLSSNRLSVMNLIAAVNSTDNDIDKIESIINKDISLSYKILKRVNSASFATATSIDSIKHAIIMLGRKQLNSWATMMAFSNPDNRPAEMLHLSMVQARTCELIAHYANLSPNESYFTTGLFSALDILMEQPIHQLIKSLPLTSEISDALVHRSGTWERRSIQPLHSNFLTGKMRNLRI